MRNVYLTGFSGSGKSTLAVELARALGKTARDLDAEIAAEAGVPIAEIFAREGEAGFRTRESAALKRVADDDNLVVATGGGLVIDPKHRALMKETGWVIRLDSAPEALLQRVQGQLREQGPAGTRPLLSVDDPLARIRDLKAQREAYYAEAHATIDTTTKTIAQAIRDVCQTVAKFEGTPLDPRRLPVAAGSKLMGRERPLICAPLIGHDAATMLAQAERARAVAADFVEVRADRLTSPDAGTVREIVRELQRLGLPTLVTNRRADEGGAARQPEAARLDLLRAAISAGTIAAFDVELATEAVARDRLISFGLRQGVPAVVSHHDFTGTPDDRTLDDLVEAMSAVGASAVKIAVTPRDAGEAVRLLVWCRAVSERPAARPTIVLGMGPYGFVTRVAGHLAGSALTFATLDDETGSAPGQPTIESLRAAWAALGFGCSGEFATPVVP